MSDKNATFCSSGVPGRFNCLRSSAPASKCVWRIRDAGNNVLNVKQVTCAALRALSFVGMVWSTAKALRALSATPLTYSALWSAAGSIAAFVVFHDMFVMTKNMSNEVARQYGIIKDLNSQDGLSQLSGVAKAVGYAATRVAQNIYMVAKGEIQPEQVGGLTGHLTKGTILPWNSIFNIATKVATAIEKEVCLKPTRAR